jgi:hypothetical protein
VTANLAARIDAFTTVSDTVHHRLSELRIRRTHRGRTGQPPPAPGPRRPAATTDRAPHTSKLDKLRLVTTGSATDCLQPGQEPRMLIARAITRAARAKDTSDSKIIISLAQTRIADTSVGLNARAVLNDKTR